MFAVIYADDGATQWRYTVPLLGDVLDRDKEKLFYQFIFHVMSSFETFLTLEAKVHIQMLRVVP